MEQKSFLEEARVCAKNLEALAGESCAYILIATNNEHVFGSVYGPGKLLANAIAEFINHNEDAESLLEVSFYINELVKK